MDRALRLEQQGQPEKALQLYQAQLKKTSPSDRAALAELEFHIGESLLAMDRSREAFAAYNQAISYDSSHRMAHLRLGEMYLLSGAADRAAEQAQAVLNHGGENLDALALLGAAASASGNVSVARNAFEDVLEKDPSRVKVALSLADLLHRDGETATARFVLLRAAKAQPKSPAPWMTLGRLEETLGQVKQAEESYRKAVRIEDAPEPNLRLAQFLERTARLDEARTVLQHVDALRPDFRISGGDLSLVIGDSPQAQAAYLSALKDSAATRKSAPDSVRGRMVARLIEADLANSNLDKDSNLDQAHQGDPIALARHHLELFRNDTDAATLEILQAEIALAGEDLPAARSHVDAALRLAPDSASAEFVSGVLQLRLGDSAAAEAAWNRAVDDDPAHVPTRLALAQLALDRHDIEEAESEVVPVVREEPANLQALMIFGRVLIGQHDFSSAEVIANRAHAVAPDSPLPDLLLGEAALAKGDSGNALLAFQKAVLEDPNSEDAVEGLVKAYSGGGVKREMLLAMEKIARQEPKSPVLLEISGRLFAEHGWNDDARRCLESALKLSPSRSSAALYLARVLTATGDDDSASRYAVLVPGISQVLEGVSAQQRGDDASAIKHYEAAVRAGDRTSIAANNLAWIYAESGRNLDRALEVAQRAVELAPGDAGVLDTLGFVRLQRREYSDAVRILQHAFTVAQGSRSPELSAIAQHLRTAYINSGQPELAAALHRPFGGMNP